MPICEECSKHISIWDVILPWRLHFTLVTTDSDGNPVTKETICEDCFWNFYVIAEYIDKFGEKAFLELLEKEVGEEE